MIKTSACPQVRPYYPGGNLSVLPVCQECNVPLSENAGDDFQLRYCQSCLAQTRSGGYGRYVLGALILAVAVIAAFSAIATPAGAGATPIALQAFCLRHLDQCTEAEGRAPTPAEIRAANTRINRAIRWTADKGDHWDVNVRAGDCEDYALTKRAALIAAGVGTRYLALRLVTTPGGQAHLTLIVRAADGLIYEMDNSARSDGRKLRALSASRYRETARIRGDLKALL